MPLKFLNHYLFFTTFVGQNRRDSKLNHTKSISSHNGFRSYFCSHSSFVQVRTMVNHRSIPHSFHRSHLGYGSSITMAAGVATPDRVSQTVRKPYPSFKVIVLNDDENTFDHVVNTLVRYIPGMVSDSAWKLADKIHKEGQAIVWTGPLEQAELYHMQLTHEGLTMAPLEAA